MFVENLSEEFVKKFLVGYFDDEKLDCDIHKLKDCIEIWISCGSLHCIHEFLHDFAISSYEKSQYLYIDHEMTPAWVKYLSLEIGEKYGIEFEKYMNTLKNIREATLFIEGIKIPYPFVLQERLPYLMKKIYNGELSVDDQKVIEAIKSFTSVATSYYFSPGNMIGEEVFAKIDKLFGGFTKLILKSCETDKIVDLKIEHSELFEALKNMKIKLHKAKLYNENNKKSFQKLWDPQKDVNRDNQK